MNIFSYIKNESLEKRDLSEQSNDSKVCKKPREVSINDCLK